MDSPSYRPLADIKATDRFYQNVSRRWWPASAISLLCTDIIGTAVANNLMRKGFQVSAIMDIKPELCKGYPAEVKVW